MSSRSLLAAFAALAVLVGACSGPQNGSASSESRGVRTRQRNEGTTSDGSRGNGDVGGTQRSPLTYVAVGASESIGVGARDPERQAWPRLVFDKALPSTGNFVNLGVIGATVERALVSELPDAVRAHPDLVTVWLNVNDIFDGVAASDYERDLTRLLQGLAETGAPVLVANTPPLDRLPAYLACRPHPPENTPPCLFGLDPGPPQVLNQIVDDYNAAIRRAARSAGAIVVDLHGAGVLARRSDNAERLVSYDGLHPSTRGHRAVAATFVKALETEGISFGG